VYRSPEAAQTYRQLGLDSTSNYIASRAAAFGAVPAEVVVASLISYHPGLIRNAMAQAQDVAPPQTLLAARLDIADRAMRGLLGNAVGSHEMVEAAGLARRAAEAACEHPEERPLFAAHAALPWPDQAHLVLWHALTLLCEWRSDGHTAVLTAEGMSGLDALVTYAATGDEAIRSVRLAHGWPADQWQAAIDRLRGRGVLRADGDPVALALTDPFVLTLADEGRDQRERIDRRTDLAALRAYEQLGEEGCARLRELCWPWAEAVGAATESGTIYTG
jgi:hypothetical protein